MAVSAKEAIKLDRKTDVQEVFLAQKDDCEHDPNDQLMPAIGFAMDSEGEEYDDEE